jgi:5-methylcytosine-specific restriction endonuclease McrA
MARKDTHGQCQLCGKQTLLTFHHLIPRAMHRKTRFKKRYSREELNQGVMVCRHCHNGIHALHSEKHLAEQLNTLEALLDDPAIKKHAAWVARRR